eukprot:CAMPEP_0194086880 /NCGR_PEP_ID=MMETSP0149-20130528/22853_1 /TAXON_ID=122233 /ORGANISM="Chaetoceros debilis, Strain MM31A-1" /LENGTH=690 /DNA_ID=CAMNT_0038770087 /DNA_START=155 /DNA_END=2227 /DNA_ORIENTATION=+
MRKRGWSIASEHENDSKPSSPSHKRSTKTQTRPRSNTDHSERSEDTLTAAEKLDLLNSFPSEELDGDDHHDDHPKDHANSAKVKVNVNVQSATTKDKKAGLVDAYDHDDDSDDDVHNDDDSDASEEDVMEMFGSEDDEEDVNNPPKKRRKLSQPDKSTDTDTNTNKIDNSKGDDDENEQQQQKQKVLLLNAKQRLSKWAARLFDPDRPRGLVEAPQIIPLNDEFLTSFGKREKEFDVKTGRVLDLEDGNLDEADGDDDGEYGTISFDLGKKGKKDETKGDKGGEKKTEKNEFKVKISNLAFLSKEAAITRLCERYGAVTDVHLLMDENNPHRSKGRAFITFEHADDGKQFIETMNEKSFEGRILRIHKMEERRKNGRDSLGGAGKGKAGGNKARYWEKDITTKCFRCGGVGHMASDCPNEAIAKPCPLCGKTGHDSYNCPLSRICFNCGVPGHINRECPERRGMPRRIVCGACFHTGHHRWECRERLHNIPAYKATCLVCGEDGHFMCEEMKWFFGLKGMSCFNCGMAGHHGSKCDRPRVDDLIRNSDLLEREMERAEAISLEEELEAQRQKRRDNERSNRGRDKDRDRREVRSRAKSQPPQRSFQPQAQTSNYGRIKTSSGNESGGGNRKRGREESRSTAPYEHSNPRGYSNNSRGRDKDKDRDGSRGQSHRSSSSSNRNKSNSRGYRK